MDSPPLVPLRLRVLGGFELHGADGGDLTPPGRKLRALVALLALAPPAGWPRERLTALLWDNRDEEQARGSLRQALAELRRTLGDSVLVTDRETAGFDAAAVHTDAVAFARLAAAGELEQAVPLYGGDLLDGVGLPDAGFADWLQVERTRLHDLAAGVLARLMVSQSGEAAIATAQRLLRLEPAHEAAHRALMRLYAAQGDRSQALRQYQLCRDSLQRDLGVKPELETERLCREIQSSAASRAAAVRAADQPPDLVSNEQKKNDAPATVLHPEGKQVWRGLVAPKSLWAGIAAASAVVLALAGAGAWWYWPQTTPTEKPVVAVLPFDDFAGDEASRRFADGLTEDIITDLARFPEFRVIARNSVEAYKGKPADAREVGAALRVGFVVEGSIQRDGDRVRIAVQLIDATSGKTLWSERWDRPLSDVFAVQAEISEQIANRLGGGDGLIQAAGRIAAHRKPPDNLTAYELYLLGTEKLEQVNRADVEEALRLLTRAVELDPGLARAWVELSHTHTILFYFGVEPESHRKAQLDAAERAVRLDPSDAEAHAVLAMSLGDRGEIARAKAEFDIALRLAPNQFEILTFYAFWAASFGEPGRGAELVDQAVRLNPSYAMWSTRLFGYAYFMAGRYEDALRMFDRLAPENYNQWFWAIRAGASAALGRTDEAKTLVQQGVERFPDLTIESIASWPGMREADRQRFIDTMRLAGFPPCAKPEALAKIEKPRRLPECEPPP